MNVNPQAVVNLPQFVSGTQQLPQLRKTLIKAALKAGATFNGDPNAVECASQKLSWLTLLEIGKCSVSEWRSFLCIADHVFQADRVYAAASRKLKGKQSWIKEVHNLEVPLLFWSERAVLLQEQKGNSFR